MSCARSNSVINNLSLFPSIPALVSDGFHLFYFYFVRIYTFDPSSHNSPGYSLTASVIINALLTIGLSPWLGHSWSFNVCVGGLIVIKICWKRKKKKRFVGKGHLDAMFSEWFYFWKLLPVAFSFETQPCYGPHCLLKRCQSLLAIYENACHELGTFRNSRQTDIGSGKQKRLLYWAVVN